tara:strand:- start:443 stop:640 length:198 start_codon:yes stop_codon:yes gene_type:complete
MTAQKKAKELVDKFLKPVDTWHNYPMCFDTAKQCALIAVDEVLENSHTNVFTNYWQEVKQEIFNL